MNEVLKSGIIWVLLSIPMIHFFGESFIGCFIVVIIGIILVIIGLIINEYQIYKLEKG